MLQGINKNYIFAESVRTNQLLYPLITHYKQ
nr:MAG TPA: hypothetical protein [Caudoviricetes sp.]